MAEDLIDKVAVVTGGASGIGAAIVGLLRARGASVVFGDLVDGDGIAETTGATFLRTDVTAAADSEALIDAAVTAHGGVDLAFLNAGVLGRPSELYTQGPFDPVGSLEDYRRVMSINVDGVVRGVAAVVPAMRARGGGSIVVTASVAGLSGFGPDPYYSTSKHALIGLVRSLAPNLVADNITINAICPSGVATPMTDVIRRGGTRIPFLPPEAVAEAQIDTALSDLSGEAVTVVHGQPTGPFTFNPVEGYST